MSYHHGVTEHMIALYEEGQVGNSWIIERGLEHYTRVLGDPNRPIDAVEYITLAHELTKIEDADMQSQDELRHWLTRIYAFADLDDDMLQFLAAYYGEQNGWDITAHDVARRFREIERRRPELLLIGAPRTYSGDPAVPMPYFGVQIRWASLEEHELAEIDRLQQQLEGDA